MPRASGLGLPACVSEWCGEAVYDRPIWNHSCTRESSKFTRIECVLVWRLAGAWYATGREVLSWCVLAACSENVLVSTCTFLVFTCISADLVSLLSNISHPCILTPTLLVPPSRNRFPLYPAPITRIYPRHLIRSHILMASVLGDFPHPDLLLIFPSNLCWWDGKWWRVRSAKTPQTNTKTTQHNKFVGCEEVSSLIQKAWSLSKIHWYWLRV